MPATRRQITTCAVLLSTTLVLSACANTTNPTPRSSATATLNWDTATIQRPLDAYGMNDQDARLTQAAQEIVWARCVLGSDTVTAGVIAAARSRLAAPLPQSRWDFGIWDSEYVASHGWGQSSQGSVPEDDGITVDPQTGKTCGMSDDYQSLSIINRVFVPDPAWDALFRNANDAMNRTAQSKAFADLVALKRACLEGKGYAIDNEGGIGSVDMPDTWSQEQMNAGALAEAQCSDSLGFTQKAADINASFEQDAINAHQAELTRVKSEADDRVTRATQVLHEVGLA